MRSKKDAGKRRDLTSHYQRLTDANDASATLDEFFQDGQLLLRSHSSHVEAIQTVSNALRELLSDVVGKVLVMTVEPLLTASKSVKEKNATFDLLGAIKTITTTHAAEKDTRVEKLTALIVDPNCKGVLLALQDYAAEYAVASKSVGTYKGGIDKLFQTYEARSGLAILDRIIRNLPALESTHHSPTESGRRSAFLYV